MKAKNLKNPEATDVCDYCGREVDNHVETMWMPKDMGGTYCLKCDATKVIGKSE